MPNFSSTKINIMGLFKKKCKDMLTLIRLRKSRHRDKIFGCIQFITPRRINRIILNHFQGKLQNKNSTLPYKFKNTIKLKYPNAK